MIVVTLRTYQTCTIVPTARVVYTALWVTFIIISPFGPPAASAQLRQNDNDVLRSDKSISSIITTMLDLRDKEGKYDHRRCTNLPSTNPSKSRFITDSLKI